MKISDLRIGIKLGLGFLALVLFTTLLGAIALVQMGRMYHNANEIATNLLPSVSHVGELRVQLNRMRRAEAGMVSARSATEVAGFAEQVGQRHKDLTRIEAVYEPLLSSDEERKTYQVYRERKADYVKLQNQLLETAGKVDFTSAETRDLTADALTQQYAGPSEKAFVAAAETLGQLQKINADAASATPKAWPRPAPRSPRATTTCLRAPSSRPVRSKKPPPPWKNWAPPCARTPTTPARPTSWP